MGDVELDTASIDIRELTLADLESLRLGWWSRFDPGEVAEVLQAAPGLSTWIPSLHEYALVGPWRHRNDIVHLIELVSMRYPAPLTIAAIERARRAGVRLCLAIEMTERRRSSFYDQVGMSVLEEVLSYELLHPGLRGTTFADIEPVAAPTPDAIELLCRIDSEAFPWLWRNCPAEFRNYLVHPGVEVHLLTASAGHVGYVGVTNYHSWGHIDRVAVRAAHQGNGFGRKLTEFAVARLSALGCARIALSTQRRNERSQSLYEDLGFRRQVGSDYSIYGCSLFVDDSIDDLVIGPRR